MLKWRRPCSRHGTEVGPLASKPAIGCGADASRFPQPGVVSEHGACYEFSKSERMIVQESKRRT
jgi:hypothetical protein